MMQSSLKGERQKTFKDNFRRVTIRNLSENITLSSYYDGVFLNGISSVSLLFSPYSFIAFGKLFQHSVTYFLE